jgi:excisionase family DNA binding protein
MPDWSFEEFMTVAEVAGLLKLNQQTIRNWIDASTLPAVRVGRRVRVLRSDLNRLPEDGERNSRKLGEPPMADAFWNGDLGSETGPKRI